MTLDDAPTLKALNDNANVYRFTGDGPLPDAAAARDILRNRILPQYERFGVGRWAVIRKSDSAFLGWCGLRFDADVSRYDLGYRFFEEYWGQGIATEAALATMAWFRPRFPGAHVVARARVENTPSIRVLEKLGLVAEGHEDADDGRYVVMGTTV